MSTFLHQLTNAGRVALMSLFMVCAVVMTAQTTVYQGPALGSWFNAANWSAGLPAVGNEALIPGGASVLIDQNLTADYAVNSFGSITVAMGSTATFNQAVLTPNLQNLGSIVSNQNMNVQSGFGNSGNFLNKGAFTIQGASTNTGTFANEGTLNLFNSMNNSGTFTNKGQVSNNSNWTNTGSAVFTVQTGGNYTNDFGANFTVNSGQTATIDGNFINSGVVTMLGTWNVTGTTRNNIEFTAGVGSNVNVLAGAQFQNFGTTNVGGTMTVQTSGILLIAASSTVDVKATSVLNNSGTVDLGGTLLGSSASQINNLAGGAISGQFGTMIKSNGTFTNTGSINTNGTIENLIGTFTNNGTIQAGVGAILTNSAGATFNNVGTVSHNNLVVNNGTMTNSGLIQIQSGGKLENNASLTNAISGRINSQFELVNKVGGTLTNNGNITVGVRLFNSGTVVNNAYLLVEGRLNNEVGGVINNFDLLQMTNGAFDNRGAINNNARLNISTCSEFQNRAGATVTNNGQVRFSGVLFQKGTLSGTAWINDGGFTITNNATANICNNVTVGLNAQGEAKAYAQSFVSIAAIDSCLNFVYLANGLPRPVFGCADRNLVKNVNVLVITPTGDSLTCVSQATIVDQLAPEFTNCPGDQFVQTTSTSATATWTAPSVTDNCTANPTLALNRPSGSTFPVGITGVNYTATDQSGNINLCQFKVTVQQIAGTSNCTGDNTAPVISNCPGNISLTTDPNTKVGAFWTAPTATDVCYPLSLTTTLNPGAQLGAGVTTVTYRATDGGARTSTCQFTITVTNNDICTNDTQAPIVVSCPSNSYIAANPNTQTAVAFWNLPIFSDDCAVNVTNNIQPGSILSAGVTNVSYTATDAKGNTAICAFKVTVGADPCPGDVAGPAFTGCPANISVSTTTLSAVATWTAPNASDNCGGATVNSNYRPGARFPVGPTIVRYTASDAKGNTSLCSFIVTVSNSCINETTNPVFSGCPANQSLTTASSTAAAINATWTAPTATDNCSAVTISTSNQPGASFPIGTTTVTYTAIDQSGNAANCTFAIVVTAGTGTGGGQCPTGGLTREFYANVTVENFNLLNTTTPTSVSTITSFQAPSNVADNYQSRIRGWVRPTVSGAYTFYVTGDDRTVLLLSTNNTVASAVQIAEVTGWTTSTELTKFASQKSATIQLVAGQDYYVQVNHKEWFGGDNVAVYWVTPNNATPTIIPGANLVPFAGCTPGSGNTCTNRVTNGLIALYDFKEGSGNVVNDKSGFGTPLNLTIENTGATTWLPGNCGLRINSSTIIRSPALASKLVTALKQTNAITIEAWVKPANTTQAGPARIATLSTDIVNRNFTLAQDGSKYVARLRTTSTDNNGNPTVGLNNTLNTNLQHVVFTRNASGQEVMYINGVVSYTGTRSGNFSNFSHDWKFALANEMSMDRTWLGEMYLVAVYSQALSQQQVTQNFNQGACCSSSTGPVTQCPTGGLTRDFYANVTSWDANVIFKNWGTPTSTNQITSFQGPSNIGDNYVTRVRGYLRPTVTGQYTFYVSGDDYTWLYLSTNNSAANATRIAFHNGWTSPGEITKYATGTSMTITLQANVDYYIELNHKEGGGGDHFAAYWKTPGSTTPVVIPAANLVPFAGCTPTTPTQCQTGGLVREYFTNVTSGTFDQIFTNAPASTNLITSFVGPVNIADSYATRVRGLVRPSVSGNYTFIVTGDDYTNLYLGTGTTAATRTLIADVVDWTSPGELYKYAAQCSQEIFLEAGKDYYIELNQREFGGGDHFGVYWRTPINSNFVIIPGSNLVPHNCTWPTGYATTSVATLALEARQEFRRTRLEWINNTGPENDIFFVERLNPETGEFEMIEAEEAFNTESTMKHFSAFDNNPFEGDNYYRVRLLKADGSEQLTEVQHVIFGELDKVTVFPNPTRDRVWVDLTNYTDMKVDITVYNVLGAPMNQLSITAQGEPVEVDLSNLPTGQYQIRIQAEGRRAVTKPVVLER